MCDAEAKPIELGSAMRVLGKYELRRRLLQVAAQDFSLAGLGDEVAAAVLLEVVALRSFNFVVREREFGEKKGVVWNLPEVDFVGKGELWEQAH